MKKIVFCKTEYLAPESKVFCAVAVHIFSTSLKQAENYNSSVYDWGEAGYDVEN